MRVLRRPGSEGFGSPPVGTLVMRVLRRPGSEGFGSPPIGTLLMRVPWGPESWLVRVNK